MARPEPNAAAPEPAANVGWATAEAGRGAVSWRAALFALGLGLGLLGLLFASEGAAAIRIWTTSTAYNHCWVVLPIAGWLAWERRARLRRQRPASNPAYALLALPALAAWLAAERLGIMEGRQFAALALFEVLALTVLGWPIFRAMAAPLAYLVFLVPFGEFVTPLLQVVTARIIEFGLGLTGIPHYVDDLVIDIPAGRFYVAEACAGLRFLIAAVAFGALYAIVVFRSPGRRLLVMVLAVLVPIVANGLRALGIVLLGHTLGSAEAAAADHLIYGWVFFAAIMLLLILAGLPFREDAPPLPADARPIATQAAVPMARVAWASALVLAFAASGPATARLLDRSGVRAAEHVAPQLAGTADCAASDQGLRCGGATVSARLVVFSPRATWAAVAAERRRMAGPTSDEDAVGTVASPGVAQWEMRQSQGQPATAVAAWLDGRPAGNGMRSRVAQAWNSVRGNGGRPVVAVVTLDAAGAPGIEAGRAHALLRTILEAQSAGLAAQAAELSLRR